jgi:hypothetical protein
LKQKVFKKEQQTNQTLEMLKRVQEPHTLKSGDLVNVLNRQTNEQHEGRIYKVVSQPLNEYIQSQKNIFIDHFYISFSKEIHSILLSRGLPIIYDHRPEILGNIKKVTGTNKIEEIYIQYLHQREERKISIDKINAILIWRDAYEITRI